MTSIQVRRLCATTLGLWLTAGFLVGAEETPLDAVKGLVKEGKYAEAESAARTLLAKVEAQSGARSVEAAAVLDVLVQALLSEGKSRDAATRELAERAIAIKEQALGKDHPDLTVSLSRLAAVLWGGGDLTAARSLLERALAIREKALGPDHLDVAKTQSHLGTLLREMGDYEAARSLLERALAIREKALGPDHPDVAQSLYFLASVSNDVGDYAAARSLFERSRVIREKALGPDHPDVAASLSAVASTLKLMGDYAGARPLFDRALAIQEKALRPEDPTLAVSLNNLGTLLLDLGDYRAARPLFERALAIWEKALGPDHPSVGNALNNLAIIFVDTGDAAAARPLHERALAIWEKALGPDHPDVARSLNNLALLLCDLGEDAAARPLYERALAIREKALGPDHPDVAQTLSNLAILLRDMGDPAAARPLHERALAIREKAFGTESPFVAESLSYLAPLQAMAGDVAGALDSALEAERIARDDLRLNGRSLSERQALDYATVRASGLNLVLTLARAGLDGASRRRVLDALVRSRAVVFDEMAARHRALGGAAGGGDAAAALVTARSNLANLRVRGVGEEGPEEYAKVLDEAKEEEERAERALAGASPSFEREFSRARIGIEQVEASLPPRSALVAIARYHELDLSPKTGRVTEAASGPTGETGQPEIARSGRRGTNARQEPSYLAFALRSGETSPEVVDLGAAGEIDRRVALWIQEASSGARRADRSLKDAEAAYRRVAADLRKRIWDPIEPVIGDASQIFLVPDGSLNLVNLAALPIGDTGYLVERGLLVHSVSTERDLVPAGEARRGGGILVLGSPAYETMSSSKVLTRARKKSAPALSAAHHAAAPSEAFRGARSSCSEFASMRFDPLPGSRREADEVAGLWKRRNGPPAIHLSGSAASEAAFKENGPGRSVIHLATHGFFLGEGCASAVDPVRLSEGPVAGDSTITPLTIGENPLVLSGLALAGANSRTLAGPQEDDGILTSEEIAAMDLAGVDWVVLSACDTGVGEYQAGEGMFGLRRAFQVAGARTVITSLWEVEDDSTRAWMRHLYQQRLAGASTAEAVRNASRAMLKGVRESGLPAHPYYWAGFVAVGD